MYETLTNTPTKQQHACRSSVLKGVWGINITLHVYFTMIGSFIVGMLW